jgi:hypothetical protein
MSSSASVKRAVAVDEQKQPQGDRKGILVRLQIWKQVFLAELLNLLERRRYDLKSPR